MEAFSLELIRRLQNLGDGAGGLLDHFFLAVTFLGDELFYILLISLLFWCRSKRLAIQVGLVLGISLYINVLIKGIFGWTRPFVWARQQSPPPNIRLIREEPSGYSFPSAHTQTTGTTWGLISERTRNKLVATVSIMLCILIPLSRLYLGVHWPLDVLGGMVIGLTIVVLYVISQKQISQHIAKYKERLWVLGVVGVLIPAGLVMIAISLTTLTGHDPLVQNPGRAGGFFSGIILGLLLERRFDSFTTDEISRQKRIFRGAIGMTVLVGAYIVLNVLKLNTGTSLDILLDYTRYTLLAIVATALLPWIFEKLE